MHYFNLQKFQFIDDLTINQTQRLLLVGFSIEESLNRMIEWLSSNFDMSINAIILNYVKTSNGAELLSRTVTIPEEIAKEKSQNPYLENEFSIMEEHTLDDVLDRLHKLHGRKQIIEKYLT